MSGRKPKEGGDGRPDDDPNATPTEPERSRQSALRPYQPPKDAPESGTPAPAPFDPEGRERLGDAAVGDVLQAIQKGVDASNAHSDYLIDAALGKRIGALQAETLAQIAAHTATLKELSDGLSLDAHREELRRLSGSFVAEMEQTLDPLAKRMERGAASSEATYTKFDEMLRKAAAAQRDAVSAVSAARELQTRDWRSLAVVAVAAIFAGGMGGAHLNGWLAGSAAHWGEALDVTANPAALCEDMGFQVLKQSDQDLVCARVFQNPKS